MAHVDLQHPDITIEDLGGPVPTSALQAIYFLTTESKPFSPSRPFTGMSDSQLHYFIQNENDYRKSLVARMNDFIRLLRVGSSMRMAGRESGINRTLVTMLRSRVPLFDRICTEVFEDITDQLEEAGIKRAVEGYEKPIFYQGDQIGSERVYSDSLLSMMLRNRRPEVYNRSRNAPVDQFGDEADDAVADKEALRQRLLRVLQAGGGS